MASTAPVIKLELRYAAVIGRIVYLVGIVTRSPRAVGFVCRVLLPLCIRHRKI